MYLKKFYGNIYSTCQVLKCKKLWYTTPTLFKVYLVLLKWLGTTLLLIVLELVKDRRPISDHLTKALHPLGVSRRPNLA